MGALSKKFTGKDCRKEANEFIGERRLLGEHWEYGMCVGILVIVVRRRRLEN